MMAVLYWIRLKEHYNINSQGYVGVSNDFSKRIRQHKNLKKISNKLQEIYQEHSWENLVKSIIFEGTKEECLKAEMELRPSPNVGWNVSIGGTEGPSKFGQDNPSSRKEVILKRALNEKGKLNHKQNTPRGESHPRVLNPEKWSHTTGKNSWASKNPDLLKRGDDHPRRKNPEKWAGAIGENHPRVLNPEKWANAVGDNHWTKKPESRERLKGKGNPHSQKIRCIEINRVFDSLSEAAIFINVKYLGNIAKGIREGKARYGYHWEYVA